MALGATLYRFRIDLTDIDRGVYDKLDLRLAKHPSESDEYLVTRLLAFILNYQDGLEFSKEGLGNPDDAALFISHPQGGYNLIIEIANPSAKKVHKDCKSARKVKIYTYKDPKHLLEELKANDIHQVEKLEIYSFDSSLLNDLSASIEKDNQWNLIHNDGSLMIETSGHSITGNVHPVSTQILNSK